MGGGNISETHARAARAIPGLEIAAIYGTNRDRVERLTTLHGGTPYLDLDAFLNHKPMDFVAIGSPSGLHSVHGIAAARRGLHVLTEKPIEISTERADELIGAARESGVKLGVMFQDRFKPDIRRLKQWIDDGAIGKPGIAQHAVRAREALVAHERGEGESLVLEQLVQIPRCHALALRARRRSAGACRTGCGGNVRRYRTPKFHGTTLKVFWGVSKGQ